MGALIAVGLTALILPTHTPGARYSKVTQATISKTVCVKGWTTTIRPPASYTNALKKQQLAGLRRPVPRALRGRPPDLARAWRCPALKEDSLARALAAGAQERPEGDRLEEEGLQRDADTQAGSEARARLQAQVRLIIKRDRAFSRSSTSPASLKLELALQAQVGLTPSGERTLAQASEKTAPKD
jgi:hypothetical protein